MKSRFSYDAAARLLGVHDPSWLNALDKALGVGLLAGTAAGNQSALALFDAKAELVRLGRELYQTLEPRITGVDRFKRTERIAAAHTILVVTSFFEALEEMEDASNRQAQPRDGLARLLARRQNFSVAEKLSTLSESEADGKREQLERTKISLGEVAALALRARVPIPRPDVSRKDFQQSLEDFYMATASRMTPLAVGPAPWFFLDNGTQDDLRERLATAVTPGAVERYEEHVRRLAVACPEFGYWSTRTGSHALSFQVDRVERSLASIASLMAAASARLPATEYASALHRHHAATMERPIAETSSTDARVGIPALEAAYINPAFRVASLERGSQPHLDDWWESVAPRKDLDAFLAGFLTHEVSSRMPLLILGQPGSGKSLLTKIIGARLPPDQFVVVRVPLREVEASESLQDQVEQAIRLATGENVAWPQFVRNVNPATPVILLDGFDELLQATGISQSDYLERIVEFQERELLQERPVSVFVTSRTAVANRTRIPRDGALCLKLEPFDAAQVEAWLEVWRVHNHDLWRDGLEPPMGHHLHAVAALSKQPLLLLMLALYDADGNALQRLTADVNTPLAKGQLYEQLVLRFAAREVRKEYRGYDQAGLEDMVENQLDRLSIVALGMLNRSRLWLSDDELDRDYEALLGQPRNTLSASARTPLSIATLTVGRFFFVHEARALVDALPRATFEFLHATFGEYLASRLLAKEIASFAQGRRTAVTFANLDDSLLFALLSWAPVLARSTTAEFIHERLGQLTESERTGIGKALVELFHIALFREERDRYATYHPRSLTGPERTAHYTANLIVLAVLALDSVPIDVLFPDSSTPQNDWARTASLWRSQLGADDWAVLLGNLTVRRGASMMSVALRDEHDDLVELRDAARMLGGGRDSFATRSSADGLSAVVRQAAFVGDPESIGVALALQSFGDELHDLIRRLYLIRGEYSSPANTVMTVSLSSVLRRGGAELVSAYDDYVELMFASDAASSEGTLLRKAFVQLVTTDAARLGQLWLTTVGARIRQAPEGLFDYDYADRVLAAMSRRAGGTRR